MIDRRSFISSVAVTVLTAPLVADAQQAGKVWRIGVVASGVPRERIAALRDGLRQLGYVEGMNIVIDLRDAQGKSALLPGMATDGVRLKPDVIVTTGSDTTHPAQLATRTIPIVMAVTGDPVESGFVASLARPGGSVSFAYPGSNMRNSKVTNSPIPIAQ